MTIERNRRWCAVAADMRDHPVVGMHVAPPKPADPRSHAQSAFVAWTDIIMSTAYTDHEVRAGGRIVNLQRGEFLAGRGYWAKRWNWGEQAVRGFFTRLALAEMIAFCDQSPNQPISVARLCNYDAFQRPDGSQQPRRQPRRNQRPTSAQPHTTKDTKIQREVRETRTDEIRTDPSVATASDQAILEAAIADFNQAAQLLRFSRCSALTAARAKNLTRRLLDLGHGDLPAGQRRFREALSALPHDAFLSGRLKGTNGRSPYRLDLDKLLSTGSRSGDVLAKLCDLYDEHGPGNAAPRLTRPTGPAISSAWAEAQAEELAAQRARFDDPGDEGAVDASLH